MVSREYRIPLDYNPRLKVYARMDTRVKFWWSYWLPNGERMRRPASSNRTIAERNGRTKERQLLQGVFDAKDKETLGLSRNARLTIDEAVDLYQRVTMSEKSGNTRRNESYFYPAIFGYFSKELSRRYIDEILQEDIEIYRNLVDQEKSRNTANDYLVCIKKLFNKLAELKRIEENPAENVKQLRISKSQKARKVYLPKEHLDEILRTPPTPHLTIALQDIIILIVNTGMRIGEVLHLEWPDIDFTNRLIRIRVKPFCPTQFGMGWKPKWGIERDVPLNETALWIFGRQPRRKTVGFIRGRDKPAPAQFVFPKAVKFGKACKGHQKVLWARCDEIRHQWNRLLRRAGLDHEGILMEQFGIPKGSYTIHDLRRTFNTYSIELAHFTQNQASAVTGNDPLVNREHYTGVIDTEIRRKIENLPFDYRSIPPSGGPRPTGGGRKGSLRLVHSVTAVSQGINQTDIK